MTLTATMKRILCALAEREKRPVELKDELLISDSTLHAALRELEERNLVRRRELGKKYVLYGITEDGRKIVEKIFNKNLSKAYDTHLIVKNVSALGIVPLRGEGIEEPLTEDKKQYENPVDVIINECYNKYKDFITDELKMIIGDEQDFGQKMGKLEDLLKSFAKEVVNEVIWVVTQDIQKRYIKRELRY